MPNSQEDVELNAKFVLLRFRCIKKDLASGAAGLDEL